MKRVVNKKMEPQMKGSKMAKGNAPKKKVVQPEVQAEGSFETMSDEEIKSGNANNTIQLGVDRQTINNITAQMLQGGVNALNLMMTAAAENLNLAAKQALDHRDNVKVLADTATGAVADAMIDQSPPDEGERQAKK